MTESLPGSPLRALLEASANSPLNEADPKSLDELMSRANVVFNMKPLDLNDPDIATVVLYFQHNRAKFAQLAREKENAEPKQKKRKSSSSVAEALRRSIDEIEL